MPQDRIERYMIVAEVNGEWTVFTEAEIDDLDVDLEYGYDVNGFIYEALLARKRKKKEGEAQ